MTNTALLDFLFTPPVAATGDAAAETLACWLNASRRFPLFLTEYRDKVRKKLRLAQTPDSLQSLLWELDVARRLVEDARCRVEYEKYGHGASRNPDFTVTFGTRTVFHLEATRVQMAHGEIAGRAEKLIRIVCAKLGQAVPQSSNVLAVAADGGTLTDGDVGDALKSLKRRVERREAELLARIGFADPAAFFKEFQWLSAVLLCPSLESGDGAEIAFWVNPQARAPLPPDIRAVLQAALASGIAVVADPPPA